MDELEKILEYIEQAEKDLDVELELIDQMFPDKED